MIWRLVVWSFLLATGAAVLALGRAQGLDYLALIVVAMIALALLLSGREEE